MDYSKIIKESFKLLRNQKSAIYVVSGISIALLGVIIAVIALVGLVYTLMMADSRGMIEASGSADIEGFLYGSIGLFYCIFLPILFVITLPFSIFILNGHSKYAYLGTKGELTPENQTIKGYIGLARANFVKALVAFLVTLALGMIANLPLWVLSAISAIPIIGTIIYCIGYVIYLPILIVAGIFISIVSILYINTNLTVSECITKAWGLFKRNPKEVSIITAIYTLLSLIIGMIIVLMFFLALVVFVLVMILKDIPILQSVIGLIMSIIFIIIYIFTISVLSMFSTNVSAYILQELESLDSQKNNLV
jgi:hypothetical protein